MSCSFAPKDKPCKALIRSHIFKKRAPFKHILLITDKNAYDIKCGIDNRTIDRNTRITVLNYSKDVLQAVTTRYRKLGYNIGTITKRPKRFEYINWHHVEIDGYIKTHGAFDLIFLDFCGQVSPSICVNINAMPKHIFDRTCKLSATFSFNRVVTDMYRQVLGYIQKHSLANKLMDPLRMVKDVTTNQIIFNNDNITDKIWNDFMVTQYLLDNVVPFKPHVKNCYLYRDIRQYWMINITYTMKRASYKTKLNNAVMQIVETSC